VHESTGSGEYSAARGGTVVGVNLSEAEARSLLGAARVARLATADEGGRPHLVPVTFAVDGDRAYIAIDHKPKTTTTGLRRLRNIERNPNVCLLADHYDEDWAALWWVRVDGRAVVLTELDSRQSPLDLLALKYPQYRERRPVGPVIVIEADRWSGWAARSASTRGTSLIVVHSQRT
jgi:PPOX class probable F420-dependent enzyme